MNSGTIAALMAAAFITACTTAPRIIEIAPVYTLAAAEIDGPDFEIIGYFNTPEECWAKASAYRATDTITFCFIQEGTNR